MSRKAIVLAGEATSPLELERLDNGNVVILELKQIRPARIELEPIQVQDLIIRLVQGVSFK